jgi:uncharacterized integral membrane protein (TIGR00697 family)
MNLSSRKDIVFLVLSGFFVTNAIVAELTGGKLIEIGPFTLSIGIIPWPIVFLSTDLINEYFGKNGVKKLSLMTAGLIAYSFLLLFAGMQVKAASFSPVSDIHFQAVFGQSMLIIIGSIIAFLLSQLTDVFIFWFIRTKTGSRMIWLRATGSTAISQFVDTFIILFIAFLLPGKITFEQYINLGFTGYSAKLIIAIALTPLIYIGRAAIEKYLGNRGDGDQQSVP